MAPRVGAKSNQQVAPPVPAKPASEIATADPTPEQVRKLLAHIAGKQAEMLPQSRWVGRDFADAARAMHEGRAPEDLIHGQASPDEARALHRSEEHTSELQSLMRTSYALFSFKQQK